jgi:hypothetical protein
VTFGKRRDGKINGGYQGKRKAGEVRRGDGIQEN